MEVIIAGATGYVGSTVLDNCIADPTISKIYVLTRRPLEPSVTDIDMKKVEVIIHTDWLNYEPTLLQRLANARACLWCIGGRHTQTSRFPTREEYLKVTIDYTLAAARAFADFMASTVDSDTVDSERGDKFRFVFCSGDSSELDQNKKLAIMGPTRKAKGAAEKGLFDIADAHQSFESVTVRPCGIYPKTHTVKSWVLTTFVLPTLQVDELAATMVEIAKTGSESKIVLHADAQRIGRKLLGRK